jgi:sulfane dehydrogenase subunit SoxC
MKTRLSEGYVHALWRAAEVKGITRRTFLSLLTIGGSAAVLAACGQSAAPSPTTAPSAAPGQTTPTAPTKFVAEPLPTQFFRPIGGGNAEMQFQNMANVQYTTPNSIFFVRDHTTVAYIDADTWQLSIEGDGIDKPYTLTYQDLLSMPTTSVTRYIECAGNGRSFYDTMMKNPASGGQWRLGAYGIAEWTGVKVSDLLNKAGMKSNALQVMATGLDSTNVRRPISVEKAMADDTILAYKMNGEILPTDHGFPARMVVPGTVGVNNIKWVGKITVSTTPIWTDWNTKLYVLIGPDYQPDPKIPESLGPAVNEQVMKSAVALPWEAKLKAGQQKIVGYAWSPKGKISKVDVSLDGGKTYQAATLVGPNIEMAGTRWEFNFDANNSMTSITPKATDEQGNEQYDVSQQKWNKQGYLFGAMVPHPITVEG